MFYLCIQEETLSKSQFYYLQLYNAEDYFQKVKSQDHRYRSHLS